MNVQNSPTAFRVANVHAGEMRSDVSREWCARPHDQRFLSLTELMEKVQARRESAVERRVASKILDLTYVEEPTVADDLNKLWAVLPGDQQVGISHWSFGQLASLVGAPAGYLRTLPAPIVADAVLHGLRIKRKVDEVKTYVDQGELLAITGPDYGRIYDAEVVEAVQQFAGDGRGSHGWKIPGVMNWSTGIYDPEAPVTVDTTTLYASDRDVFMFLVDDRHPIEVGKTAKGEPDLMFRGFYVKNSEVGAGTMTLAAFYLRAVCQNRCLWGVEGFEELTIRHTKMAPSRFIEQARPALMSYANGSTAKLLAGVAAAKAAIVAKDEDERIDFLTKRGVSRKKALAILEQHESEEFKPASSAWDMAQAITAAARAVPYQDERLDMERIAKGVLDKAA